MQGKPFEQVAAYSGAADDGLSAQRIADLEARLERLTKRRDELSKKVKPDARRRDMKNNRVKKNMEVIGADGVHIGTVDRVTTAVKDGTRTITTISSWN